MFITVDDISHNNSVSKTLVNIDAISAIDTETSEIFLIGGSQVQTTPLSIEFIEQQLKKMKRLT